MSNEVILTLALIINYSAVVLAYHFFGKEGLYCFTVLATIAANIEVLIIIRAFGMEQTLGNILFASTFLVTDILSEMYGRKAANKAVKLGIAGSAMTTARRIINIFFLITWSPYTFLVLTASLPE